MRDRDLLQLTFPRFDDLLPSLMLRYLGLTSISVIFATPVLAQDVPVVPPTVDPSRIEREIQPPPPPPQEVPQIVPPPPEEVTPPPAAEQVRFRLESLQIQGATVYTQERLQQVVGSFLGQSVTLQELYAIADRITQLYRNDGYLLSRAIVPEQTIENGVVRIQVIEGFIEQVNFQGAPTEQLQRLIQFGEKITSNRPLNIRSLERYLLLMNDLAGFQVQAVLSPGATQGAALLTANVNYNPTNAFFDINNRGTEPIGPVRSQGGVYFNSRLFQGEQVTLSGTTNPLETTELGNVGAGISLPVGAEGLRLNLNGSYTQVKAGGEIERFGIEGYTTSIRLGTSYPLIRSRNRNLTLSGEFDFLNSLTTTLFIGIPVTLSEDRLRSLRVGLTYNATDSQGVTFASTQLSQGIPIFGATTVGTFDSPLSRARGRADYTKVNLDIVRLQNLDPNWTLQLSGTGQFALSALLSPEQFGLGGATFGSAFEPSQLVGDSGYGVRAELQRRFIYRTDRFGVMVSQPYIFADYGQVFRKFPSAAENSSDALSSAGLGIRQYVGNNFSLQGEVAFPLRLSDRDFTSSPRLFFGVRGFF